MKLPRTSFRLSQLVYLLAASAIIIWVPTTAMAAEKSMERTITVSASGSIDVEPDAAHITSGVLTTARTARAALDQNNDTMANVIDGLKSAGIRAKDIQTSSINVQPRYQHNRDGQAPRVIGYQVTNQVNVFVRELDNLGEILDRLVSLGANQMHGLNFVVTDADQFKDDARVKAIENARRRADIYARAAGTEVGKVLQIIEGVVHAGPVPRMAGRAAMAAEAVPIERGTQSLEVQVTATWALE